jgi:hypothetical protein
MTTENKRLDSPQHQRRLAYQDQPSIGSKKRIYFLAGFDLALTALLGLQTSLIDGLSSGNVHNHNWKKFNEAH